MSIRLVPARFQSISLEDPKDDTWILPPMSIRFIIVAEMIRPRPASCSFSVTGVLVALAVSMLALASLEVVVLVVFSDGFVSMSLDSSIELLGLAGTLKLTETYKEPPLSISSSKMQLKPRSPELSRQTLDEIEDRLFWDGFLRLAFWRKVWTKLLCQLVEETRIWACAVISPKGHVDIAKWSWAPSGNQPSSKEVDVTC